jgi:hypothetical protein
MTAVKKRGRPPTGKAATGAERVRKFRQRAGKDGGRRLDLVLDRASVDALGVCMTEHKGTVGELVGSLLRREAARLGK